jgi:hypothetical protein
MRWIVLSFCVATAVAGSAWAQRSEQRPHSDQAVSADLIRLHDELHLSAGQEDAWREYTRAIAPNPQTEARHRATTELLPSVPTPRRIALIEATMAQDDLDFRRQAAAVNAFYSRLTPSQQQVFDRDTLPSGSGQRPG